MMSPSPRDLQLETQSIETVLPVTYRHRPVAKPKLLVMFLHGFSDHGGSFIRRLFGDQWPASLQDVAILVPNGPFPVPVKTDTGWREAYSWYFYNDQEARMIVSPDTAVTSCQDLVAKFGYEELPKIMVAFSQGGYLAPYLAQRLRNTKEIIGFATGYREDYYPKNSKWRVTAIHGANDEIFPIKDARAAHDRIRKLGFDGDFYEIAALKHVASADVGKIVEERVCSWL